MSFEDGWAAINLEMPKRVPRTEYSAARHWALVRAVTGREVTRDSPDDIKEDAVRTFVGPDGWNYDIHWSTLIAHGEFNGCRTNMGHAVYADGGTDYDDGIECPFKSPEEVLRFDPAETFGMKDRGELVRRFEDHYCRNREAQPDGVNMTGVYVTCVSGLISLFGWDMLLLAAGTDSEAFGALTNRYAEWIQQYFDALAEADVPVVMVHDDMVWTEGAIFHPDWYRTYIFPNFKKYIEPILDTGKRILFTSDGSFSEFIDDLVDCGFHGFAMEPTTDMAYVARKYGQTHVFVGNADTRILLSGTKADIRREVERCMSIGKQCPGFIMAVGNHIPPNTPVENALYYNEVYTELSKR